MKYSDMTHSELRRTLNLCRKMGVSSLKIGKTVTEITLFEPHHQPKSLSAGVEDSQAVIGAKEEPMPTAEDFLFYSSPFDPKLVQNKETA